MIAPNLTLLVHMGLFLVFALAQGLLLARHVEEKPS